MKIDNLKQVLEAANLDQLPKRNDNAIFKYAIGLVSTTAADESYCLLNMYEGKPNVRKIFVGGMIKDVLAVFPYEFDKNEQVVANNTNVAVIEQKAVKTPDLHDNNSQELKEAQKKLLGDEYGGDWGIISVHNPEEARKYFIGMAKNGYPEYLGKSKIKDEARLKEEFLKMVDFIKTL